MRFGSALPADTLLEEFLPEADTCTVESDDDDSDDDDLFPNATGRPFNFVSAGNALTFTSPAGTFLTLPLVEERGFAGYRPESRSLPAPFRSNLTLGIGGKVFSAFDSVPVVDVEPLNVLEPAGDDGIAATTTFRWEAAASGGARVEIDSTSTTSTTATIWRSGAPPPTTASSRCPGPCWIASPRALPGSSTWIGSATRCAARTTRFSS